MFFESGAVRRVLVAMLLGWVLLSTGPGLRGKSRCSAAGGAGQIVFGCVDAHAPFEIVAFGAARPGYTGTRPESGFEAGYSRSLRPQDASHDPAPSGTSFSYKFENPRFAVSLIEIEVDPIGSGRLRFKRGESDEIIERPLGLSESTMSILDELVSGTGFLTSNENYQAKKDFSHLGWVTISANRGGQQRTVKFNYTTNTEVAEMAAIFRAVADQELDLFDLELAVQNQPLELPNLLDALENDLREGRLANPQQLVKPLRTIAQEDSLPLIARNHANRLIAGIDKGRYKAPFKAQK
jgi:hypothetical protein